MTDPDKAWAALIAGEQIEVSPTLVGLLLARADNSRRAEAVADRRAGLEVAGSLGGREGLAIVGRFVRDADPDLRRRAFDLGVAAKADGIPVVREAVLEDDPDLTFDALRLLVLVADRASTGRARAMLGSTDPRVRGAAAELLGHVGGAAVRVAVGALKDDPDEGVREKALEALERLEGRKPRRASGRWWEASAQEIAEEERPAPITARVDRVEPARVLLRQIADDPAHLEELRAMAESLVGSAVRGYRPGADPALARGIAVSARLLDQHGWATTVRRLLADPEPSVRAAAAESLGAIGRGPSVLTALAALLEDGDATVREATVRGLGALGGTLGRPDLIRDRLAPLAKDPVESVRTAREQVLASLDGS